MPTKITTTTIKKDGTTTTHTTTHKKKASKVTLDGTTYTDYKQCIHVFGVKVDTVCKELIDTIDKITGYWPLGERNSKLLAIRHVMDRTACFSRNLTLSIITSDEVTNSAEDTIDF